MPEIILEFPPDHLRKLKEHPLVRAHARGRTATRDVAVTYFDTPDTSLRRRGVLFSVERTGQRFEQTVVFDGITAYRGPTATDAPAISAIDDIEIRNRATPIGPAGLRPLFHRAGKISRKLLVLDGDVPGAVEFETGTVSTDTHSEPYGLVRIANDGDTAAPSAELARNLVDSVPIRLSRSSIEDLGFALATNTTPTSVKGSKRPLQREASVEESMAFMVRSCLEHLIANEACTLQTEDPEGIHQMRVAMRRMRSALRLYRDMLPPHQYEHFVGELRWITGEMGPTRDLDVFLAEIATPVAANFSNDDAGFSALDRIGRIAQDEARSASRQAISSPRYARFILDLTSWLERRGWREQSLSETSAQLFGPVIDLSDAVLDKRYRRVRKRGRTFEQLAPAERHQLRIDIKKLRYALDFFGSLYRAKDVEPFAKHLSRLQDALGYANDVEVAQHIVDFLTGRSSEGDETGMRRVGGLVIGWHTHAMTLFEREIGDDLDTFLVCRKFWTKPARAQNVGTP